MTPYRQCPRDGSHVFASPAVLVAAWRSRTAEPAPYPDDVLFCQVEGCDGPLNPGPPAASFGWPAEPDPVTGPAGRSCPRCPRSPPMPDDLPALLADLERVTTERDRTLTAADKLATRCRELLTERDALAKALERIRALCATFERAVPDDVTGATPLVPVARVLAALAPAPPQPEPTALSDMTMNPHIQVPPEDFAVLVADDDARPGSSAPPGDGVGSDR